MIRTDMESYRERLLAIGNRLKKDVANVQNEALRTTGGEASGNLSNAPMHPADLGTDTFNQEVSLGLYENEEQLLEQVSAALRRIDEGSYGQCSECGQEITRERLDAIPYSIQCVACARELQGEAAP